MKKHYYQLTYQDNRGYSFSRRKYMNGTAFNSVKECEEEYERIKREQSRRATFFRQERSEWQIEKYVGGKRTTIKKLKP